MLTYVVLTSRAAYCLFSRDTPDPVAALQGEFEEGHRRQRAGENRQVEHPFPAHRLPFLQLSGRVGGGRSTAALAAGLAQPSSVRLQPAVAVAGQRSPSPCRPSHVVISADPRGDFQGVGKALPSAAELCCGSGVPRRPIVLFSPTFLRGPLRKASSGNTERPGRVGDRALWLIATCRGGPGPGHHL